MIRFEHVSVTYAGAAAPVLRDVDVDVPEGELCLVTGVTGSGKSTLLATINGLVPHFTGGRLSGRVVVDGRDTRTHPPRELADVVGVVLQDPVAGFVTDTVEEELAYSMEQLGLAPPVMRRRVDGLGRPRRVALRAREIQHGHANDVGASFVAEKCQRPAVSTPGDPAVAGEQRYRHGE